MSVVVDAVLHPPRSLSSTSLSPGAELEDVCVTELSAPKLPYARTSAALTGAFHAALVAIHITVAKPAGATSLTVSALHLGLLLAVFGPKQPGKHIACGLGYYVPCPVNEPVFTCLALLIGLVEFFWCGMETFYEQNWLPCPIESPPEGADGAVLTAYGVAAEAAGCIKRGKQWVEPWTMTDRLFFSMVLLTTVGYGNTFTPSTPLSRIYVITYAIYGLVVFGAASFVLTTSIPAAFRMHVSPQIGLLKERARTVVSVSRSVSRSVSGRFRKNHGDKAAVGTAGPAASAPYQPPAVYAYMHDIFQQFVTFVVWNLASAFIFTRLEDGWRMGDAIYHCMMTSTTIGLGDIAPHSQAGRGFAVFHMAVSVVLFANIISAMMGTLSRRDRETKKAQMLEKSLDQESVNGLDRNGDGVDKFEYVVGMLEMLDIISEADYKPFADLFDQLDKGGTGKMTSETLRSVCNHRRAQLEMAQTAVASEERQQVEHELHRRVNDLLFPTGLLCTVFVWHTVFGYVLLASAIFHGLAIGVALGHPAESVWLRRTVAITAVACAFLVVGIGFIVLFIVDPATYMRHLDPFLWNVHFSELGDNGVSVAKDLSGEEQDKILDRLRNEAHEWHNVAGMVLYLSFQIFLVLCDLRVMSFCMSTLWKAPRK